jgi:multiple sugar transport system permease protein
MSFDGVDTASTGRAAGEPGAPRMLRLDGSGALLIAPAALLLIVLFVGPVLYAFYLGFTNISLVGANAVHYRFTGLSNLTRLWNDRTFWLSLRLTAIFLATSAIFGVTVTGLLLAVLIQHAAAWLRTVVGAVVVVAWMLPPLTAALLWYAFSTKGGTLSLLSGGALDVLNTFPMTVVCIANVWATAGFSMLILSAALRSVSSEVLEAGRMEGASRWQIFFYITLPIIRPTIVTNILLVVLLSLANFSLIYIMTAGGPGNATDILPIYSYQQAFQFSRLGYGALLGDVVVLIATVFAYLYVRAARAAPRRRASRSVAA